MYIESIRVEEGFLDGLEVKFRRGLNVIIGARGVGKTSVVELLRFALGAPALTERAQRRAREHALSVLGPGRVLVRVVDGGQKITIDRSASDREAASASFSSLTILSQSEVEQVGLEGAARLALIDRYDPDRISSTMSSERNRLFTLRSMTEEIGTFVRELADLKNQQKMLAQVPDEIGRLAAQEFDLIGQLKATDVDHKLLENLNARSQFISQRTTILRRLLQELEVFHSRISDLVSAVPQFEILPTDGEDTNETEEVRQTITEVTLGMLASASDVGHCCETIEGQLEALDAERSSIEIDSRNLRRRLERIREGAGEISRRISELREQDGKREALSGLLKLRQQSLDRLVERRFLEWANLELIRSERSALRLDICEHINAALGPQISCELDASGNISSYANAIALALRGSGMRYTNLSSTIAERLKPIELLRIIEEDDSTLLSDICGIPVDRSTRIIDQLREGPYSDVITAPIDDAVDMKLLDRGSYKSADQVSMGQRATIILPVLLSRPNAVLVIDQPEDNLDNAFINETLALALRKRDVSDQFIFTSHNPNIPVLGEADWIIHLDSDGAHGRQRWAGTLSDEQTVQAIVSVMEGGREAFEKRAEFYGVRGLSSEDG